MYEEERRNLEEYEEYYERNPGPSWPIEEECEYHGHLYYGDQYPDDPAGMGGRCACGQRVYPTGGPTTRDDEETDESTDRAD